MLIGAWSCDGTGSCPLCNEWRSPAAPAAVTVVTISHTKRGRSSLSEHHQLMFIMFTEGMSIK